MLSGRRLAAGALLLTALAHTAAGALRPPPFVLVRDTRAKKSVGVGAGGEAGTSRRAPPLRGLSRSRSLRAPRCAAPSCARAPSRSRRGLSVFEGTPRRAFRDRGSCASDTHGGLSVVPLAGQACTHGDFTHVDPDDTNICWTTADAAAAGAATEDSCGQWCTLSKTHGSGCDGAAANLCSSCRQITCPEGRVLDDGSYDDYLAEPSELVCCTPGTGRA